MVADMKVYVLIAHDFTEQSICGVFSSLARAKAYYASNKSDDLGYSIEVGELDGDDFEYIDLDR